MAKYISLVFTPFYLPVAGLLMLFLFSYLNMLPWQFKVQVMLTALLFTVLLPTLFIYLYNKYQGWSFLKPLSRERRAIPYIISILCYYACYYIMNRNHLPHLMGSIVAGAITIQVICGIVNNWWKISEHTAAVGGVTGGLMAFSLIFNFNPLWWLCFLIILAGILGTGRMLLRMHSLGEVVGGFLIGVFSGFIAVVVS